MEGLLDQYVAAAAATHAKGSQSADPELPLLLSAALVSLLRVQPMLADHVGHLGYVPKLLAAMANEGRIESLSSRDIVSTSSSGTGVWDAEDGDGAPGTQTSQERVRLSCLRVLHQLAASTACAEAMATPGMGTPQVSSMQWLKSSQICQILAVADCSNQAVVIVFHLTLTETRCRSSRCS